MTTFNKMSLRACPNGHQYYKSTECPTCPECERLAKPSEGFMLMLSSPARRALQQHHIHTVEALAQYTEKQILALHGIGPASLPALKRALKEKGLTFRKEAK